MRLTVLGSSASYAGPGRACAGHLVEAGDVRVLFDCGNGVLSNLGLVIDPTSLDAIFITHYHPDHFVDLFALQALLRYAPDGPAAPLPLYLPEGLFERMKCLLSERGCSELDEAFVVSVLEDRVPIDIGPFTVTPLRVKHTEPTFALTVSANGSTLAYTADSAPGDHLIEVLRGADLALSEATLPEAYHGGAPHLTGSQAGAAAKAAGAGRLVLAHIWPTIEREQVLKAARDSFGGSVVIADEMDVFDIP